MRASPLGMRLFTLPKAAGGLGPEIVIDGTFTSSANWNLTSATISGNQVIFSGATGFACWQANAGIVTGHTYQMTFTLSSYSAGTFHSYVGSSGTTGSAHTANGTFTDTVVAGSNNEVGFFLSGGTGNCSNFSVKEVL